jgi:hypothetical protein
MGRRDFLRRVGVGGTTLTFVPRAGTEAELLPLGGGDQELTNYYPGSRYLLGPWRLRLDRENAGKKQEWHHREPSDAVARAVNVNVPSCWQEYVPGLAGGVGWYFKEFSIPSDFMGRVLRLKFWAVDYFAEVWVNGQAVGNHEGGYTPFEVDFTQQAKAGENRLIVRVVDPPRPLNQSLLGLPGWEGVSDGVVDSFKFMEIPMGHQSWQEGFNFGGIWQPVELLETNHVYISDVFVEPKLEEGAIEAHVEVISKEQEAVDRKVCVIVKPWKEGDRLVGHGEKSERFLPGSKVVDLHVRVRDPHPWSPDDPYLYVAEVALEDLQGVQHKATARFGLREFTVKDGYFHLNGRRIFIKGGHHQGTYPTTLEYPPTREFAYKEARIFKEAGFNFCRLWVKPAPGPFLDAADELGLMLQEEPPLSIMEDSPLMLDRSVREVREMVKRDRNRPSIVIWNMINEADPPMKYVRQECEAARALDPTRLIMETAGGPTHYYGPYSTLGVSYLDEHPYAGAPIADDVYDYNRTRGIVGQLCFFSEYGYGGMNDLESVLARYGANPKTYMEDYIGHDRLKALREKAFEESNLLKGIFHDMEHLRDACQGVQADAVQLHTEAMRCNPAMGGYNYVQVFDSNAFELDGLVDFWREKRKKAFYVMQEANKPLLLVVRCAPMNARSGEDVGVTVTLVNEEQITGRKRLTVRVKSPSGVEVLSKETMVEAKPWVSTVFQETVKIQGETGRYPIEAIVWEDSRQLVRKEDFCTIFAENDVRWPSVPLLVLDPDGQLTPFLDERRVQYQRLGSEIQRPAVILITPSTSLWRRPDEFQLFFQLFYWVDRGCSAIFLEVPNDGSSLLTSAPIFMESFLSPFAVAHITPFDRVESADEVWARQRVGAYSWGLTDRVAGVPIPYHPVFKGVPQSGIMGREYGNVVPVRRIRTDWSVSEDTGSAVQIYSSSVSTGIGKGRIIITSLNLLPNLKRDALAEKMLCNLVSYAQQGLPAELYSESSYSVESLKFQAQGYKDCITKYLQGKAVLKA